MSGHSKWHNIARKKGLVDQKRAKVFTRYAREMAIAIREGGADPTSNSKLKDIISKAKGDNVPNDNINRILQKYQGGAQAENYEHINYEGYGPAGVAVIVETITDNRNRTVSEMRHYFDKYGGNMGAAGCVSWQFDQKGVLVVEAEDRDEEEVMMQALDAGASDFDADGDVFEIYTEPNDLETVRDALAAQGFTFLEAEVQMVPQNYITLTNEDDIKNMNKLLEMMDGNDDVQNVWHNWENADE